MAKFPIWAWFACARLPCQIRLVLNYKGQWHTMFIVAVFYLWTLPQPSKSVASRTIGSILKTIRKLQVWGWTCTSNWVRPCYHYLHLLFLCFWVWLLVWIYILCGSYLPPHTLLWCQLMPLSWQSPCVDIWGLVSGHFSGVLTVEITPPIMWKQVSETWNIFRYLIYVSFLARSCLDLIYKI